VNGTNSETASFRYEIERAKTVPWKTWMVCRDVIIGAFRFSPVAGTLNLGLPDGIELPLCGNPKFRTFTDDLFDDAPGLPIFVLGGNSPLSRELLLASLPNLQAATDGTGAISVSYPAIVAQQFLHDQFAAMLHAGISEECAVRELTFLSRQCGMEEAHWG
jgi:hypothetical protein